MVARDTEGNGAHIKSGQGDPGPAIVVCWAFRDGGSHPVSLPGRDTPQALVPFREDLFWMAMALACLQRVQVQLRLSLTAAHDTLVSLVWAGGAIGSDHAGGRGPENGCWCILSCYAC